MEGVRRSAAAERGNTNEASTPTVTSGSISSKKVSDLGVPLLHHLLTDPLPCGADCTDVRHPFPSRERCAYSGCSGRSSSFSTSWRRKR
jgi:hypothetical protein